MLVFSVFSPFLGRRLYRINGRVRQYLIIASHIVLQRI